MNFSGRVAVITGAGGGLGRVYALHFAERGAAVVVNDLGGDMKGAGASSRPADLVVEEIKSKGGKAVANYDSVEFGERIVADAIKHFGRIDIVVNNAGILRDRSFIKMTDEDWDLIQKVHLRGSFKVTRAAWPYMKEQNFGRIIMVSSPAGIYGNFGQANYSAAKLALVALSNTLAKEGGKYNIKSNAIAPTAASRLLQTVLPQDVMNALKPEYISPLVLYLCHESCQESGGLFECGAGWIGKTRWQSASGALVAKKDLTTGAIVMTPEDVCNNWDKINNFDDPVYRTDPSQVSSSLMTFLGALESGPQPAIAASANSQQKDQDTSVMSYTDRDVILYALGVGCSTTQDDHLKFLYEYSDDFSVLPTFGVLMAFACAFSSLSEERVGFKVELAKLLHGEQYLELFRPLPTAATLTSKAEIVDVLDKGSGAVILLNVTSYDDKGEKVAFNQLSSFVVGAGGFGGKRDSNKIIPTVNHPDRKPDAVISEKTSVDQAALYRLSGDRNPLHIDPAFAAMGGFDEPILHGLATLGFSTRHVLKQFAAGDVSKFKAVKVRFTKPVLPGQTIQTNMWKEGNRVFFESVVVENGNIAISGGYMDLHSSVKEVANEPPALKSTVVFEEISKKVLQSKDLPAKVGAIFHFCVTQAGRVSGSWTVDLKSSPGSVYKGEPKGEPAGCTLILEDDDFIDLVSGKLNAQKAFMTGKLKVKGNVMLSQKLELLFARPAKL